MLPDAQSVVVGSRTDAVNEGAPMCAVEDAPGRVSQPRVVGSRADAVEPLTACRTPGSSSRRSQQYSMVHSTP